MTIRLATSRLSVNPVLARMLCRVAVPTPANDCEPAMARDQMLRLALRLFADHGLAAAARARDNARAAHRLGNHEDYQHWLTICRTLDRRMADATERHTRAIGKR